MRKGTPPSEQSGRCAQGTALTVPSAIGRFHVSNGCCPADCSCLCITGHPTQSATACIPSTCSVSVWPMANCGACGALLILMFRTSRFDRCIQQHSCTVPRMYLLHVRILLQQLQGPVSGQAGAHGANSLACRGGKDLQSTINSTGNRVSLRSCVKDLSSNSIAIPALVDLSHSLSPLLLRCSARTALCSAAACCRSFVLSVALQVAWLAQHLACRASKLN